MSDFFQHEKALVSPSAIIGTGTRVWAFANIQDNAHVGEECNICDGCFIEEGVQIGNHVTLKNGVNVFKGVTLEDGVFCGANTAFINDRYPRSLRHDPWVLEETFVHKGVTIGSNATILCGLTIGTYAFIGAGSVVTKDVAPHEIVCGNPAVFQGYVCVCGNKLGDDFHCVCGAQFEKTDHGIVRKKV